MQILNIHAAKTHFSRLVDEVAGGEEIIIARAGKPVARLVPLTARQDPPKRALGILSGRLPLPDDFDAPLSNEELADFEGR
jgi:prevent-host-death family protein